MLQHAVWVAGPASSLSQVTDTLLVGKNGSERASPSSTDTVTTHGLVFPHNAFDWQGRSSARAIRAGVAMDDAPRRDEKFVYQRREARSGGRVQCFAIAVMRGRRGMLL